MSTIDAVSGTIQIDRVSMDDGVVVRPDMFRPVEEDRYPVGEESL